MKLLNHAYWNRGGFNPLNTPLDPALHCLSFSTCITIKFIPETTCYGQTTFHFSKYKYKSLSSYLITAYSCSKAWWACTKWKPWHGGAPCLLYADLMRDLVLLVNEQIAMHACNILSSNPSRYLPLWTVCGRFGYQTTLRTYASSFCCETRVQSTTLRVSQR